MAILALTKKYSERGLTSGIRVSNAAERAERAFVEIRRPGRFERCDM